MVYTDYSIDEVLLQFGPMIWNQIKQLHIYRDQDEYFQLGLIGLWKAYNKFDSEKGVFPAFAQKAVKNELITQLRKESRIAQRYTATTADILEVMTSPVEENILERDRILSYCDELTEKQFKWVIQGIIENKRPSEIAEKEGVTVEQVKGWRRDALRKIRKNINEDYKVVHQANQSNDSRACWYLKDLTIK
ncbi:sigma-70 family RNA polymerase sigma factor [Bacillus sp. Marseille-P3661]|uniref:sigma-70 family RNA polymerase sigma factor n=1 Tax=Bacillus sp. Marseille-P3661 TaxID=1936234 RepID=UPI000C83E5A0|nr:sigma-70 family RNA polymerase sigma factor [Bacillus sp. Marseille-P3661]